MIQNIQRNYIQIIQNVFNTIWKIIGLTNTKVNLHHFIINLYCQIISFYISIHPLRYHHILGKPKLENHINRVPYKARNKRSVESNEEEIGTNEKRDTIQSTNENENLESKVETYEDADDEEGTKRCKR